jgi:SAM-dependent methyltransferase
VTKKIGLSPRGRRFLATLRVGQDAAELAGLGLDSASVETLLNAGLLEQQGETMPPADYQDVFGGWKSQKGMLIDDGRTLAFDDAIRAAVNPGDRVVDVGTGSGILAMMAARAGADQVYALEVTAMADWAERLAAKNGLTNMQVVRGDAAEFDAGGPVDVVIGEFAGMWFLEEWRHYAAFVKVRDQWLKPEGRVVPYAARLYLSAVDSRKLHFERGWGFFDQPVYGFDFSDVLTLGAHRPARYILSAEWKSLVATQEIARFDFKTGNERDYLFTTELQFEYPVAGMFHGFIGHFDLDMVPGQVLSTSCGARETCWHQSYFPMPAIAVPAGQSVTARLRCFLTEGTQVLMFGITVAGPGQSLTAQAEHVFDLE